MPKSIGVLLALWRFRWRFRFFFNTEIDISKLLPDFIKHGKGQQTTYGYKATIGYRKSGGYFLNRFYLDAPYGIILHATGKDLSIPIACITFDKFGNDTIRIQQIQGPSYSRGENEELCIIALSEIKWERLLVQLVRELAELNKVKRVEIISCTKSRWYKERRHQKMFMRYDVTARRMGFKKLAEEEVYSIDTRRKILQKATA